MVPIAGSDSRQGKHLHPTMFIAAPSRTRRRCARPAARRVCIRSPEPCAVRVYVDDEGLPQGVGASLRAKQRIELRWQGEGEVIPQRRELRRIRWPRHRAGRLAVHRAALVVDGGYSAPIYVNCPSPIWKPCRSLRSRCSASLAAALSRRTFLFPSLLPIGSLPAIACSAGMSRSWSWARGHWPVCGGLARAGRSCRRGLGSCGAARGLLQPQLFAGMPAILVRTECMATRCRSCACRGAGSGLGRATATRQPDLLQQSADAPHAPFPSPTDPACRHVPYPLRLDGFLRGLGPLAATRFGLSFLRREASLRKFLRWEADRSVAASRDDGDRDPGFAGRSCVSAPARRRFAAFYRPYVEKVWACQPMRSRRAWPKRVSTAVALRAARGAGGLLSSRPASAGTLPLSDAGHRGDGAQPSGRSAGAGRPFQYQRAFQREGPADAASADYPTGHLADLAQLSDGPERWDCSIGVCT